MIRRVAEPTMRPGAAVTVARTPQRGHGLADFARRVAQAFPDVVMWTVVDVGASDGWFGAFLSCRWYVPCDRVAAGAWLVAEGAALPFRAGAFDLAVCKQVLPHSEDPLGICRELRRVARRGLALRQELPTGVWPTKMVTAIDAWEDLLPACVPYAAIRQDGQDCFLWL